VNDTHPPVHGLPILHSVPTPTGLAGLLASTYGLDGVRCRLIKGTIRDTYLVESSTGRFVCSIYRRDGRSPAEIEAELDLLDFLDRHGAAVAPARASGTGGRLQAIDFPEGIRQAVLFRYVPGNHLGRQPDPEPARRYGRAIARIHALTDTYPRTLTRPGIGVAEIMDRPLSAFTEVVTHRPDDVAYLRAAADVLARRIERLPGDAPGYGLVHGDVIPSNAQVMPSGEIAVLDFDFCGFGWRAYDIATYLGEVQFWDASASVADAFLAGYEEIRPLAAWERTALPVLQAARHIHSLGTPAMFVDLWGSAYLSDRMIDVLVGAVRTCMDAAGECVALS
jgi:Ser/Thr protein kinase RdoA (MazF antagonist)